MIPFYLLSLARHVLMLAKDEHTENEIKYTRLHSAVDYVLEHDTALINDERTTLQNLLANYERHLKSIAEARFGPQEE